MRLDYPTILSIPQLVGKEISLLIDPCPKPRMTRRDSWQKRDPVLRYRAFKDSFRAAWPDAYQFPSDVLIVCFGVKMPKSWSAKKRDEHWGQPHRSKPDVDNLLKALMDAAMIEDKGIHTVFAQKVWSDEGFIKIVVYPKGN